MATDTPNSDTVKTGNPWKKDKHEYGVTTVMSATTVIRYVGKSSNKLNADKLVYEFSDGSGLRLTITQEHDYNVYLKFSEELRNIPSQQRRLCDIDLWWEWRKPDSKHAQDWPKVTDIQLGADPLPKTPKVQMLLDEIAERHPELNEHGEPRGDEPLINPHLLTDDEKAAILAKTQAANEKLMRDAKGDTPEPARALDEYFPRDVNGKPIEHADEKPAYNWTLFWVSVRNLIAGNDLIIDDHHKYVHKFFDVPDGGSLKGSGRDPADMLRELSAHFNDMRLGKESTVDTTPDTTNDELTAQKAWYEIPENMQVIKSNLEALAEQLSIAPSEVLTEAEKEIGNWSDFATGREALAKVKASWQPKVAQKAAPSDESAAQGPVEPPKQEQPAQPPKPSSIIGSKPSASKPLFQKATKKNSKLRLAIGGVPGGGKTWTALQIATEMFPNGKIAVLDTESGSAEKYADKFDFDVLTIEGDFKPERFIDAIHVAEDSGYDVLIIDSFSHEWAAPGGILDIVDNYKTSHPTKDGKEDGRAAWGHATPRHNDLVTAILQSKIHIIATMRCKWKTVPERDKATGKVNSIKVIGDLEQRSKIEFEFDIVALCDQFHNIIIDKSRCSELDGYRGNKAGGEVAKKIASWLNIAQVA